MPLRYCDVTPAPCSLQCVPPSVVATIAPSPPTAQPSRALTKVTAFRSSSVTRAPWSFQCLPPSVVASSWPLSLATQARSVPEQATPYTLSVTGPDCAFQCAPPSVVAITVP